MSSMESLKKKNPANDNQHASLYKKKRKREKVKEKKKEREEKKRKKKDFPGNGFRGLMNEAH